MVKLGLILVIFAVIQLFIGFGVPLEFDMENLNASQTAEIGELRDRLIKSDLVIVLDYMLEDYHLGKWLAFKDFDLDATFEAIKEDLEWRKQENIYTIANENWDDMRKQFPYTRNTVDKAGRPVVYFDFDNWDVAAYLGEAGEEGAKRLLRYWAMFTGEAEDHVRRLRAEGKNVTQFSMLSNLASYSTSRHACIQCLWLYREGCYTIFPHFLPTLDKITVVNAPLIFRGVFHIFSSLVQKNFVIYGQDRRQWESMLLDIMEETEIPSKLRENANPPEKDNSEGWLPWKFEL